MLAVRLSQLLQNDNELIPPWKALCGYDGSAWLVSHLCFLSVRRYCNTRKTYLDVRLYRYIISPNLRYVWPQQKDTNSSLHMFRGIHHKRVRNFRSGSQTRVRCVALSRWLSLFIFTVRAPQEKRGRSQTSRSCTAPSRMSGANSTRFGFLCCASSCSSSFSC